MGIAQAQILGALGTDTFNSRVVPIILVPGVMGSRIEISGTALDWDPDDKLEMGGWLRKDRRQSSLDVSFGTPGTIMTDMIGSAGSRPGNDVADNQRLREIALDNIDPKTPARARRSLIIKFWGDRGWGEASWAFYGSILMDMATRLNVKSPDEPHPVYVCGYDWRQSNLDSADTLIARIDQVLARHPAAKQVILVTHSMGGLVVRAALTKNATSKILGVIHAVQPADGAVVAYRRFFTGATTPFDNPLPLNLIMGRNRVQYCLMQSGLRGPTELLPMNSYPNAFMRFGAGITNKFVNVYDEYPKQTTPGFMPEAGDFDALGIGIQIIVNNDLVRLRRRITQAGDFAKLVANVFHDRTFVLFGDGITTDVEFDFNRSNPKLNGSGKDPRVSQRPQGDGTVPAASARCESSNALSRASEAVTHAECFAPARFRDLVIDRVRKLMAIASTPGP